MALNAHIVWEMRASASNNNGGGTRWVSLVNATYKWTASGSGTDEFYGELAGGGDPSLTEPNNVTTDGTYNIDTNGTLGSLNAGEWDWGDNDTLGYSTVYVRLDDGADPDTKNNKFVSMVFGGGTDYSLQDAAQFNPTDLACLTASTTLTSATGGFTAAMVGNIIYITAGTNFAVDWYVITAYTDTNTVTIDRTAASGGDASAGTGYIGGARVLPVDTHFEAWVAGNKMYMEAGTYTLTGNVNVVNDGTSSAMMQIEGYNSIRGDAPTGTNRPLIAAAANQLYFDAFWRLLHIRVTITVAQGLQFGVSGVIRNCKSENSSGTAGRDAFRTNNAARITDCEGISTNGDAFQSSGNNNIVQYCYFHDSDDGILTEGNGVFLNNILDTIASIAIGISSTFDNFTINHNTIYNAGTGISLNNSYRVGIWNNQIINNTTGITAGTEYDSWSVDYNNYNGNTTDVSGVKKGLNATSNAPGFADAANGNFADVDAANGFGTRLGVT